MEKEFIPYEQALALKELGFDEPCFTYFLNGIIQPSLNPKDYTYFNEMSEINKNMLNYEYVLAPTYSQAFRWFREKYDLHHKIDFEVSRGYTYNEAYFFIIKKIKGSISVKIQDNSFNSKEYTPEEWNKKCKGSYKEAELECLKKLIEIIKNK